VEWAERVLDGGGAELKRVLITRNELQRLRIAAKEPSMAGKPRTPGQTRRLPVRRDDGANEDDPAAGGAVVGNCGRDAGDKCGMTDPDECSVHGGAKSDPDADATKSLAALLRQLLPRRKDGDPESDSSGQAPKGVDDPPVAHEDAIRLAHKCMRTSKAFVTEGMTHHAKALSLLDGVVDALDADPISATAPDNDPDADPEKKAAQLRRAAALKAKHKPA
jgi:hypothetical protein